MPVIALVGNKGGAGKTTLTVNLAVGLNRLGSVIILDTDPQGSSAQWRTWRRDLMMPVPTHWCSLTASTSRTLISTHCRLHPP